MYTFYLNVKLKNVHIINNFSKLVDTSIITLYLRKSFYFLHIYYYCRGTRHTMICVLFSSVFSFDNACSSNDLTTQIH